MKLGYTNRPETGTGAASTWINFNFYGSEFQLYDFSIVTNWSRARANGFIDCIFFCLKHDAKFNDYTSVYIVYINII